jgi:hypothetical protein
VKCSLYGKKRPLFCRCKMHEKCTKIIQPLLQSCIILSGIFFQPTKSYFFLLQHFYLNCIVCTHVFHAVVHAIYDSWNVTYLGLFPNNLTHFHAVAIFRTFVWHFCQTGLLFCIVCLEVSLFLRVTLQERVQWNFRFPTDCIYVAQFGW